MLEQTPEARDRLLRSESLYRQAIEASEGIPYLLEFVNDGRLGVYHFVGTGIYDLLGVSASELTHAKFTEMVDEELVVGARTVGRDRYRLKFFGGEVEHHQADVRMRRPNGSYRWVSDSAVPICDPESRKVVGSLGILYDITDRKNAEIELARHHDQLEALVRIRTEELRESNEKLRRSERLASVGTLAAGIAHEVNSPLFAMLMAAEQAIKAQTGHEPNPVVSECLEQILADGQRCARIVKNVLKFARQETCERWPNDLNRTVRISVDITQKYATKRGVQIQTDLAGDLPQLRINPVEIQQVLVNLIRNAVEACKPGCRITLSTSASNEHVRLEVRDTGEGMSDEFVSMYLTPSLPQSKIAAGRGWG